MITDELSLTLSTLESRDRNIEDLIRYNKDLLKDIIMVFSEEEYPQFSQGFESHELLEPMTAEYCTNLINIIKSQKNQIEVLQHKLDAYSKV